MPVYTMGKYGGVRSSFYAMSDLEHEMDMASMQSVEMVPLPKTVDQMLGAPTQVQAPDPLQVVKDKLLSVMTEEDLVVFKDMMKRVNSVMTPTDMALLAGMAANSIEQVAQDMSDEDSSTPYMSPSYWMNRGVITTAPPTPVIPLLDETEEEDEGVHPGYNAVTKEDAIRIVARYLEHHELKENTTHHFDDMENMVDSDGSDGLLRKSLSDGSYSISTKSNGLSAIDAMLSGSPTTHYVYSDGRVSYDITHHDIADWKLTEAEAKLAIGTHAQRMSHMQNHANGVYLNAPTGNYVTGGGTWRPVRKTKYIGLEEYMNGETRLPDTAQRLTGFSYDQIQEELKQKREAAARVDQIIASPHVKIEVRPKKVPVDPLLGVPALPPQPVVERALLEETTFTEEALVALANEAKHEVTVALGNGLKITTQPANLPAPPPKQTHTATYVPAVAPDVDMTLDDLLAEVRRTFDFCADNWNPFDSKMSSLCLGVLDVFENYTPRTTAEVEEAKKLCVDTLKPIHEILAVAMPKNMSQAAQQYFSSTSLNITPAGLSAFSTAIAGNIGQTINITLNGFTGVVSDPAVDRCWKLLPGHTYHLDDGSKIEIDATGNYTIHDKDANITYRASRVREFNRFINGSDLVADFLETLAKLGTTQEQAAKAPLEMFIRWLVFKAAEHDHEAPPTDMTPLTETEVQQLAHA